MTKAGSRLIRAAQEARSIARGEADPSTYALHVPPIVDVAAVRRRKRMTQAEFATRYGLNVGRVRDWEQGRSRPDSAARAYLMVIDQEPEAVERVLAAPGRAAKSANPSTSRKPAQPPRRETVA